MMFVRKRDFLTGNGHLGRRFLAVGELVQLATMSVNGHEICFADCKTHRSDQRPPRADRELLTKMNTEA